MSLVPLAEQKELARAATEGGFELVSRCACGGQLPRPAPRAVATCDRCLARAAEVVKRQKLLERIPGPFRGARLEQDLPPVPEEARLDAKAWLEERRKLLTIAGGRTGSGKTTLAAAVAIGAIEQGEEPVWIRAAELRADFEQDQAKKHLATIKRARFVVLDGIGKELAGATPESPLAIMRMPVMQEAIAVIHERTGARFVLTVDASGKWISSAYGDDAARRIASRRNATVIVLERKEALDVERGG